MTEKKVLEERFWNNVTPSDSSNCWEWQGSRDVEGYGRIMINWQDWKAHRLSYFIHYENLPDGLLVCHTCDNPPCVNPSHLWLGTLEDNAKDRDLKKRNARGEKLGPRKLTSKQVIEIREKLKQGQQTQDSISVEYKISQATIALISTGKIWKWLDGNEDISAKKAEEIQRNKEQLRVKALELRQMKLSYLEIGKRIGCSQTTAYRLVTGKGQ